MTPSPSAPTSSSAPINPCRSPRRRRNKNSHLWRSVWSRGTAPKKRHYRREKLFRFFNWRNMSALLKTDHLRPGDSRGIPFPRRDRQQFVLLPPRHQRRHFDTPQPVVQPFLSNRRIPQKAPHRIAILHRQLVRENLPQRVLIHPARIVENRLHHSAHRRQRTRIQIRNRRVLPQPCRIHKYQPLHRYQVRAAADLRHVERRDPSAQRFAHQARLFHLQLPQKLIQKIHIRLNAVIQQRLVRSPESNLVGNQQSVFLLHRLQHRQPIFLAAPQSVQQHHHRTRAHVRIMNRLSKHRNRLVRRLPLSKCRNRNHRHKQHKPKSHSSAHIPSTPCGPSLTHPRPDCYSHRYSCIANAEGHGTIQDSWCTLWP